MKIYNERIKGLREDRDKTQQELAEYLHIAQNTYSQYENGKRELPINSLIALCKYYKVSSDYILGLRIDSETHKKLKSLSEFEQVCLCSLTL